MNTEEKISLPKNDELPLRDIVFLALREAIHSGKLLPGERLMEIPLSEQLGVSRTPVREAIRKLELEGLVHVIPRRGAVVAEITVSDLEDVLEVRAALERLAAVKACRNMTKEQLHRLKEMEAVFVDCTRKDDLKAIAQADVEFHEIISRSTGNHRLMQLLGNLREQIYRYRLELLKDRSTYGDLISEHEQIIAALEEGNEEKAEMAVKVHIENQKHAIIDSLNKQ